MAGLKPGTVHSSTGSGLSSWQTPNQLLKFYLLCKICWTGFFPPCSFVMQLHTLVYVCWFRIMTLEPHLIQNYTNTIYQCISPDRWNSLQAVNFDYFKRIKMKYSLCASMTRAWLPGRNFNVTFQCFGTNKNVILDHVCIIVILFCFDPSQHKLHYMLWVFQVWCEICG